MVCYVNDKMKQRFPQIKIEKLPEIINGFFGIETKEEDYMRPSPNFVRLLYKKITNDIMGQQK